MNKEELLQELSAKVRSGEISRQDISSLLSVAPASHPRFSVTKILYIVGAAIVMVGVLIFMSQIWELIGSFGRIVVTLGFGVLVAAIGSMLMKQKPEDSIGTIFHFIGGMLIPAGAVVTVSEFVAGPASPFTLAAAFGIIFASYLIVSLVHKRPILTFFAIANGTAFVYLLVASLVGESYYQSRDLYAYLTMAVGASYLLLAYSFLGNWNRQLVGALYFFGSAGFLAAAFSQVFNSIPWQLLYFLLVAGGLFLSVYLKSRGILIISTLFLIVHVSYITGQYFANSLGWPISLVILGFVFIGLGYASVAINKKYIKGSE